MPVQLDLFGSPLRPPKKIREDEVPAPVAPAEPESEKVEPVAESYVAVIHPKDNKQGWQTITTREEQEAAPMEEQEDDATGVNEEAAIGQEAFVEETPVEDSEDNAADELSAVEDSEGNPVNPVDELSAAEKELLAEMEIENAEHEIPAVLEEQSALADNNNTEELETEGVENFSEEETAELDDDEPIVEEFTDGPVDDFVDEEPAPPIDEEPAAAEEETEEIAGFSEEELEEAEAVLDEPADEVINNEEDIAIDQNPTGEQTETEGSDTFDEEEIAEPEEEPAVEEIDEEPIVEDDSTDISDEEPIVDEIETEGTETFTEEGLPELDEVDVAVEELANDVSENVVAEESLVDDETISEDELVVGEETIATNGVISLQPATAVDEIIGKQRGRKPIQDYDDDASNLNVPPDEELFKRQYYSMRETAAMFGVNQSLLRFWENEFKILQPKKNKKGDRYFRPVDVKNLVLIYHLLRVRKFTMEGAKEYLQSNKKAGDALELSKRLEKLKSFLLELKASL